MLFSLSVFHSIQTEICSVLIVCFVFSISGGQRLETSLAKKYEAGDVNRRRGFGVCVGGGGRNDKVCSKPESTFLL